MRALVFRESLSFDPDFPPPVAGPGVALVAPILSGICGTDLELTRGYSGFQGVLGHEFVGRVVECDQPGWLGQRVVGEINWACGQCAWCRGGGTRNHCPRRKAMGIRDWNGAFADLVAVPIANLHRVPAALSDEQAVFTEPLASGYSLLESLELRGGESILGIGDGRLGLLIAQVLRHAPVKLAWCGRHESKLEKLRSWGIESHSPDALASQGWDIVVEASGGSSGLELAQRHLKPRGKLALKTTTTEPRSVDFNALVVNEWQLIGSRCGPFEPALQALAAGQIETASLIERVFALEEGEEAFRYAARRGVLKVLLRHNS